MGMETTSFVRTVLLDENLSYEEEPVAILDREIRKLRSRKIASIKVQWKNRPVEEATWEKEADMRERYPHLFKDSGTPFRPCFPSCDRSGRNDGQIGIYCNNLFSRFEQQILFLEK